MSAPAVTRRQALVTAAGISVAAVPALALAGQASGPGVPADRLLIAAETEITRLYDGIDAPGSLSDEESDVLLKQAIALDDYVATAVPTSLSDCAVKLRRVLDQTTGMVIGCGGNDIPSLVSVLDYIERVTGAPNHPTRPIARQWGDGDGT
jgi:hypothetical protein